MPNAPASLLADFRCPTIICEAEAGGQLSIPRARCRPLQSSGKSVIRLRGAVRGNRRHREPDAEQHRGPDHRRRAVEIAVGIAHPAILPDASQTGRNIGLTVPP